MEPNRSEPASLEYVLHLFPRSDLTVEKIPVVPNIDATILAAIEEKGNVLDMHQWHGDEEQWCGTAHCRGGWAIHLAGKPGKALEDKIGSEYAARLIYEVSRPGQKQPDFFDDNAPAMLDIKKCAATSNQEQTT